MTATPGLSYTIRRAPSPVPATMSWESPPWTHANTLEISHFRPESSGHRPRARAKLLYDDHALHLLFRVSDRYVRAQAQHFQDPVCKDACVEFFVQPLPGKGYFNFELNCGGTLLLYYIEDPTRLDPEPFKKYTLVPRDLASLIKVAHSLPKTIDPEITTPVEWSVQCTIPLPLFEHYLGPLPPLPGQTWRANFYKCADDSSHPHWAAWSPIDQLNFHLPSCFAPIRFE